MGVEAHMHLLYVADPMCSWCYCFSPVITALAGHFAGRLTVKLVMGGLRAGNTRPMQPQDKDYIRNAWTRVHAASGQPFDFAFFDRDGFVYDTEPACRAVVTMRRLLPEKALGYMGAIQRAFYAENRDVTQPEVLSEVAGTHGVPAATFTAALLSPDSRNETFRDFLIAQEAGVQGFPTLLAGSESGGYTLVTSGYRPLAGLPEALEEWLAAGAEANSNR